MNHVLFIFATRFNLDPDGKKSDSELWEALDIAQLKDVISAHGQQLGMSSNVHRLLQVILTEILQLFFALSNKVFFCDLHQGVFILIC